MSRLCREKELKAARSHIQPLVENGVEIARYL